LWSVEIPFIVPNSHLLEIATTLPYQEIDFFRSALEIDIEPDDPALII
jgi:hypothetical protein